MTEMRKINFAAASDADLTKQDGVLAVFVAETGALDAGLSTLDAATGGLLTRLTALEAWSDLTCGKAKVFDLPSGLTAEKLIVVKISDAPDADEARLAGAEIAKAAGDKAVTLLSGGMALFGDVVLGLVLRGYAFTIRKEKPSDTPEPATVLCDDVAAMEAACAASLAVAEGVFFTRDLTSEPANVLGTEEFVRRLLELQDLGVEVEVLEEADMEKLGMKALLGVGQGSAMPSKMVIMRWKGGEGDPLALVGKGVVFDTGGISIKPAGGMEDMTMDMGGAGVVSGVMKTLALRKAPAHVVGLVGLVENMPDGLAQRPGDIVTSAQGTTIEVINTDAEGRLVLADVLWYAQEFIKPAAMVDLATLTGACIIALGHENAGVMSNNDAFADQFLAAAKTEGEGAWRLPLGKAYDDLIKSYKADIKNTGGRAAGTITAAQFLQRFVKDDMPWIHLDIAGVAQVKSPTTLSPKGATGWGVMALDRLVRDQYE